MNSTTKWKNMPRLPLEGHINITFRCNNHCLHCWAWTPDNEVERKKELSLAEINRIVIEARALGCRFWVISGGEPLLRPDFSEIFNCLTHKSIGYNLNTNGTLITPQIARLLTRKGSKMISLYGATAEVYDQITRNPGGFEKLMQGFAYLKEAGAGFIVQLIPMQANWHQWHKMISLAESLSPFWRVGASFLFLSGSRSQKHNQEIIAQRLPPAQLIAASEPNPRYYGEESNLQAIEMNEKSYSDCTLKDDRLFADCIEKLNAFHINPYGKMSWCSYVNDPKLLVDLRKGSFTEAWEKFIPACSEVVRGGQEWFSNCGSCEKRSDCNWCAVYAYLETGRYSAPIPYLCKLADEKIKFKKQWQAEHRRYFRIAGITVCLESDLSLVEAKFSRSLSAFSVEDSGEDEVVISHRFELPDLKEKDLGQALYCNPPWSISLKNGGWFYRNISSDKDDNDLPNLAIFHADYSQGIIFNSPQRKGKLLKQGWQSLSLMQNDLIWLAPLMVGRNALILRSTAVLINGQGLVFVDCSDPGKRTTSKLLLALQNEQRIHKEVFSNGYNVIRNWPDGWYVNSTWNNNDVGDTFPFSAPLRLIVFLEATKPNSVYQLTDHLLIRQRLQDAQVQPMVCVDEGNQKFDILKKLSHEIPSYYMRLDQSTVLANELERLIG